MQTWGKCLHTTGATAATQINYETSGGNIGLTFRANDLRTDNCRPGSLINRISEPGWTRRCSSMSAGIVTTTELPDFQSLRMMGIGFPDLRFDFHLQSLFVGWIADIGFLGLRVDFQ